MHGILSASLQPRHPLQGQEAASRVTPREDRAAVTPAPPLTPNLLLSHGCWPSGWKWNE